MGNLRPIYGLLLVCPCLCRFILMGQYVMSSMTWLVLYLVIRDPGILEREKLDGKTYHTRGQKGFRTVWPL